MTNEKKGFIAFLALVIAIALIAMTPWSSSAGKKNDEPGAIYNCEYTGVVNMYAERDEEVIVPFPVPETTFHEYDCDRNEMRVYKTIGNTELEWNDLKAFAAKHAYKNYPEAVCGDADKSRLISLSHFYYRKYFKLNTAEENNYKSWIKQYVDNRPACTLFATDEVYNGG